MVGCAVGSCCHEVSVSLASRRKTRRVGVWMEDDEAFGASKAVRSAAAVSISCWMFGAHYYAQSHTALYPFLTNQGAPVWKPAQIAKDGTLASTGVSRTTQATVLRPAM